MNVVGIIAEYNPFHNGHLFQIEYIKEQLNPDYIIVVLGNNFTQRGEAAILDKFDRAELALKYGVDLVIEMPTILTCSSAEYFAHAGVSLLDSLGVVTHLCFGAEATSIITLSSISKILSDEDKNYKNLLKEELKKGLSFPAARTNAVCKYVKDFAEYDIEEDIIRSTLGASNNILATEYLKALSRIKSKISPYLIHRKGPDFNSEEIVESLASATNIRKLAIDSKYDDITDLVPDITLDHLKEYSFAKMDDFSDILKYKLTYMDAKEIGEINGVREGIENKIADRAPAYREFSVLLESLKTKRHTLTSLNRILTSIILNITKEDFKLAYTKVPRYVRVLGFRKESQPLLTAISKSIKIPFITNFNQYYKSCLNRTVKKLLSDEIRYNNIYHVVTDGEQFTDLTKKLVITEDMFLDHKIDLDEVEDENTENTNIVENTETIAEELHEESIETTTEETDNNETEEISIETKDENNTDTDADTDIDEENDKDKDNKDNKDNK